MDSRKWDRILVLQTSFLGDTVLTLPLFSEIKRRFPSSQLSVLCSPVAKELLQDHPDIDEIIVDDKRGVDRGLRGLWRIGRLLRDKAFALALTPHKSLRSALILFLGRIPYRVGFRQSRGGFLFHRRVNRDAARHDVERTLSLLEAIGVQPSECERAPRLPVSPSRQFSLRELLHSLGASPEKWIVGVNPGSVWPTKRWSTEGFAKVIALVKNHYDCQVVLFGGPDDVEIVAAIQDLCGSSTVSLAGKLSLRDLPAALSLCRVLVTNDSGPMHIGVACAVPTVAIFCATTPGLGFYPYSAESMVIEKNLPCRPCSSHGGRRCPLGTEACIRLIDPEHVFRAVEKMLTRKGVTPLPTGSAYRPEIVSL